VLDSNAREAYQKIAVKEVTNTQTPLYEQVGQQVANLLYNKFVSGAPDTNLYNLLADILH
jgi:hypothetical protein